jgi:hypothetical protein
MCKLLPQVLLSDEQATTDSDNMERLCHHRTSACVLVLLQGGRPPGSSKKAAAAVAGTSKPQFKAMPVTFNFAVGKVLYLQAELLSALAQIE